MLFDHKPKPSGPQEDLANLKVTGARVGDVLSVEAQLLISATSISR